MSASASGGSARSANEGEPVGLTWIVLLGFLRLATNPRMFPRPLPMNEAIACVNPSLAHPNPAVT